MASFARFELIGMQPASAQERVQPAISIILLVNDEADPPRTGHLQDDRIHPCDVIRQEQKTARGQILRAGDLDPINQPRQPETEEIKGAFAEGGMRHCLWFTISARPTAIGNSMTAAESAPKAGARTALGLLLGINLFNYIDRQVLAALEPQIRATFFEPTDFNAMTKTGALGMVFLVTYMLSAPALGWLSDRFSRWIIIGTCVILWSLASGASGLAATFGIFVLTRVFVGIGEGGYGPAAPTILSDLFPIENRGRILAIFCAAIPVGSALGYVVGGAVNASSWLALGILSPDAARSPVRRSLFFPARPARPRHVNEKTGKPRLDGIPCRVPHAFLCLQLPGANRHDLRARRPRFLDAGLFAISGISPTRHYHLRRNHRRRRTRLDPARRGRGGSSAETLSWLLLPGFRRRHARRLSALSGRPLHPFSDRVVLHVWRGLLCFPEHRTIEYGARQRLPAVRPRDRLRPEHFCHPSFRGRRGFPTIGYIGGHTNMHVAFLVVSGMMLLSGVIWLAGMKYFPADTAAVEAAQA